MAALVADERPLPLPVVPQGQGAVGAHGPEAAVLAEEEGAVPLAGGEDHGLPPPLLHLAEEGEGPPRDGKAPLPPEVQEEKAGLGHGQGETLSLQNLHRGHQGEVGEGHPEEAGPKLRKRGDEGPAPRGKLVALAPLLHHHQRAGGEGEEEPAVGGEDQAARPPEKPLPDRAGKPPW